MKGLENITGYQPKNIFLRPTSKLKVMQKFEDKQRSIDWFNITLHLHSVPSSKSHKNKRPNHMDLKSHVSRIFGQSFSSIFACLSPVFFFPVKYNFVAISTLCKWLDNLRAQPPFVFLSLVGSSYMIPIVYRYIDSYSAVFLLVYRGTWLT